MAERALTECHRSLTTLGVCRAFALHTGHDNLRANYAPYCRFACFHLTALRRRAIICSIAQKKP